MNTPQLLSGLFEVAPRYSALLCDVWGVIHNGRERFPAACEALVRFNRERGPVILVSNAPRPSAAVHGQLDALGVPRQAWSAFVSSGDATRALLAARAPGPAWWIGPERDAPLVEGLGLDFAGPEDAAFIVCSGLVDDEVETPEDYRAELQTAAGRGLPMICANPDRVVQKGDRLIYCAGALADLYGAMEGEVVMAGKPYAAIYDLALAEVERLTGRRPAAAEVLCVGDGIPTDVMGADGQGFDCLFVAEGIHAATILDADGPLDPERVEALLAEGGTRAAYAMRGLAW